MVRIQEIGSFDPGMDPADWLPEHEPIVDGNGVVPYADADDRIEGFAFDGYNEPPGPQTT